MLGMWGAGSASSGRRAGAAAGIGSSLLAAAHRPQQHPRAGAQQCEVGEHLNDEHDPGGLGFGSNVPETTVAKTVTLKYRASVRVSGWVKFAAEARSITKYVEANSSK
jgi:hypothetical protein